MPVGRVLVCTVEEADNAERIAWVEQLGGLRPLGLLFLFAGITGLALPRPGSHQKKMQVFIATAEILPVEFPPVDRYFVQRSGVAMTSPRC